MERVDQSRIERVNKKRRRKWIYRILILFLVGMIGIGGYLGSQIWNAFASGHDDSQRASKLRGEDKVEIMEEPFSILLLGTDKVEDGFWRPDVIMVATINPKTNSMKLLSIPRDTYVEIANTNGHKDKINSSAFWGKRKGVDEVSNTRETVENFLNIPIDYYAKVDFQGFMDIVDALNGVDVNVPFYFSTQNHEGDPVRFYEGPMHLNGEQALAYVRMRKKDPQGDIGRNARQREVVAALVDKMVSFGGITKFADVTEAVGNNFTYSFKTTDIPSLIATYKKIPKERIETVKLETTSERKGPNQIWYEIVSQEERIRVSEILQQQLEFEPKQKMGESEAYSSSSSSDKEGSRGDGN